MSRRLLRLALACYPRTWRKRYGRELDALVDELLRNGDRSTFAMAAALAAGAALERVRALREVSTSRAIGSLVVLAAVAAAVFVTIDAPGRSTEQGVASAPAERQLHSTLASLCTRTTTGKRVTAVDMDPRTGKVLFKIAKTCSNPA